jgi:hypothetical protein
MLLARRTHPLELRRDVAFDDAVGVHDPAIDPFAGGDMHQLLRVASSAASACQSG